MQSPGSISPTDANPKPVRRTGLVFMALLVHSFRTLMHTEMSSIDRSVKVLLVDDQPIVAESIRRLLASETDIELHYCQAGQDAIPMATKLHPTVILQDLVMPDTDGLMLVKFFRANPATRETPIIVLSTRDESTYKAQAFATGANDYLVKVPDAIELIARLRYHSTAYTNLLKRDEAEKTLAYNKELEQRVTERTSQLQAALENVKKAQTQLIQDEKMASLGQLVAGLAHEINNPINFIYGNLSHAQEYIESLLDLVYLYQQECQNPSEKIQDAVREIDLDFLAQDSVDLITSMRSGANRIRDIILSLRNFSRLDEAEKKFADIHVGLENTLLILNSRLHPIEVIKDFAACPQLECSPGEINQVFVNLLMNAADAIQEKLKQLSFEELDRFEPQITIRTRDLDGDRVQIEIIDNGIGIHEAAREKIFDPFFTTKPIGKGTGLGLSISYQIVTEKHNGRLKCQSTLGQGSTFIIEIPTQQ